MKLRAMVSVLVLCAAAGVAQSETILVNDQVMLRQSSIQRPSRGMPMEAVEKRFGAPVSKHAAVGKPPITRWDYQGFSVFFEYNHVIHSVAVGG